MGGIETGGNEVEQQNSTVSSLRTQIAQSIEDSKLTNEESDNLKYALDSALDGIQSDTFRELQSDIRARAEQGINITAGGSSERAIGNYLGIDLFSIVNFLKQDGYNIPENYSIRDNGTYLVFHDESGKDIATMNWETRELGGGGYLVGNDDTSDNYTDLNIDAYAAIKQEQEIETAMNQVKTMKEDIFNESDGGVTLEDPLDYASLSILSEPLGVSESELRQMVLTFQKQVVMEGFSPFQEELWKNIRIYKGVSNEIGFSQHTPQGEYYGAYNKQGNFLRGGIYG